MTKEKRHHISPESPSPRVPLARTEITQELERSYLDYAMSVIVARALPDVRDGLKPVHRRILWAMWDSGLLHNTKYRKSANVVGEVLGRYHPHGDTSVYDAMVRMAQNFSLRYPLIDGQGNWGSVDGDNAAAMRYTETRLARIASELLADIEKDTVDFVPNYDATRKEPRVLPAKLPNLLLNGTVGIAVGMATDIPPHNLGEVVDALFYLIKNPDATTHELLQYIQGPDFPTGGIIYDTKNIAEAYATGQGSITCRARAEVVERKPGHYAIVVSEIPYRVNKSELIQKIAQLANEKRLAGIKDLRDESDKDGLSVVIELKGDTPPQKVLNQLYKHTELQKDFHMNMIALVGGLQPQLLSLKDILEQYLEHRIVVVRRRTAFDLARAKERAHILEGLSKALDHIDAVIATIKKSRDRDDAHTNLVKKFRFTEVQATAILEMKLQTLASLERKKINEELGQKRKLITELEAILASPQKITGVIERELGDVKERYADPRRTQVVKTALAEFKEEDLVPQEEAIITLSAEGYIKRLSPAAFRLQNRGGKGLMGSEVREDDFLTHLAHADTHDSILFFTDSGKVFQTKVYEIPQGTRTAKGKIIHNFLDIPPDEKIRAMVSYNQKSQETRYLVMVTAQGLVKKTAREDFTNVRRSGIIAISLKKDDALRAVLPTSGRDEVLAVTASGQAIRFKESDLRSISRAAAGVRGMKLKSGDAVVSADVIRGEQKNNKVLVMSANGFAKQTSLREYKVQARGGQGIRTAKITPKTGAVVSCRIIGDEEEAIVLSAKGQVIKTRLSDIRESARATSGVRVMRLSEGDSIVAITCV